MAAPTPHEQRLLAPVTRELDALVAPSEHDARLDVLEALASQIGGFSLDRFTATDDHVRVLSSATALDMAERLHPALAAVPIPSPLALTALSRRPMGQPDQRKAGAYYTDFRLAQFLAGNLLRRHRPGDRVVDPASGTGILLVALALAAAAEPGGVDDFIARSVHAADLSTEALRGTKLALASLTADDAAIAAMAERVRATDSLTAGPSAWSDVTPMGFQTVIANPPWEKLKVTRHELLASQGVERHYGTEYGVVDQEALTAARARMAAYVDEVSALYELDRGGDGDLYKLFLALSFNLAADDGQVGLYVPAGLIRSQGTEPLRGYLLEHASDLHLTVLDNKASFFAIDTRFKFLAVRATLGDNECARRAIVVEHGRGAATRVELTGTARLGRGELRRRRPDLTVPEVRSREEWRLYRKMADAGKRLGDMPRDWPLDIMREVDMTNDREMFTRYESADGLPVIEGRMVHQFRDAYKAYVSGSGRSAVWRITEVGHAALVPQFWVDPADLSRELRARVAQERVGFCDITGQTNERTMLAARVPAGAVCGNKVPTISFGVHPSPRHAGDLWLAVANSFAFDWLLRRQVTTTVNYFVLKGINFPDVTVESRTGQRLIELGRLVEAGNRSQTGDDVARQIALWRAEMDALVCDAYGLDIADVKLLFRDFPLLDRGQVPLPGEHRSTVTRDLVLDTFSRIVHGTVDAAAERRLADALLLGATAYIPAEAARARRERTSPVTPG